MKTSFCNFSYIFYICCKK